MRISSRLARLERAARARVVRTAASKAPMTVEQEADLMGVLLWMMPDCERHDRGLATDPHMHEKAAAFRAWDVVLEAARAAGHEDYHVGMRPEAMAVWIAMKPELLEFERTHSRWKSIDPAPGAEPSTP
jgi:hypothetical protein